MRSAALALVASVLLSGCAAASQDSPPTTTSATTTSTTPTSGETMTELQLTVDGRTITVELDDTPTARDLAAQLPLSLTFSDYGGQEKTARLPRALSTEGAPADAALLRGLPDGSEGDLRAR